MSSLKKIYKKEIPKLLNDSNFWKSSLWPITPQRLYALYHNPQSEEDDIVLFYFENEKQDITSYISIYYSEILYDHNIEKIGVASAWYSDPNSKAEGAILMVDVYKALQGKLLSHMFDINLLKLYRAFRLFHEIQEFDGFIYQIKPKTKIEKTKHLLSGNDQSLKHLHQNNISLEYISVMEDSLYGFISQCQRNHLMPKPKEYFNYLFHYKWVIEAPLQELEVKNKYYFSNTLNCFQHYGIKIYTNTQLIAFLIISKSASRLKVLHVYHLEDQVIDYVAQVIYLHAQKLNCQDIICYHKQINQSLQQHISYYKKTESRKVSMLSKKYHVEGLKDKKLFYGDGDCCFT